MNLYNTANPLNDIVNSFFKLENAPRNSSIKMDQNETNESLFLYFEIPGAIKESIVTNVSNNKLTVSCTKKCPYEGLGPMYPEIIYGNVSRTVTLPFCVTKKESLKVDYTDGILRVEINKSLEENTFNITL